jgi:Uma2 family endonuclease
MSLGPGMVATDSETVAELIERLGGIPAERIRFKPTPGTATEADVIRWMDGPERRLFELIDGVLVEKAVGTREGFIGSYIARRLWNYAEPDGLGVVGGADAPFRFRLGLVRFPDVSFVSWNRIPGDEFPEDPIARLIPDLAVEVLSESNTPAEIELKLDHYFEAGVRAAWVIDPKKQSAVLYGTRTRSREIGIDGDLTAPKVLPGFRLPLRDVFASLRRKKRKPR